MTRSTLYVDASSNGASVTIRGVALSASLRCEDKGNGVWASVGDRDAKATDYKARERYFHALHCERKGSYKVNDIQQRDIRAEFERVATEFAKANPRALVEAEALDAATAIERLDEQIEECRATLRNLEANLEAETTRLQNAQKDLANGNV